MRPVLNFASGIARTISDCKFHTFAAVAGAVLLSLLTWRALGFVHSWDGAAFHLPYAAKIAGFCSSDCFELAPGLDSRYDYIPKFGQYLFAGLWWITGEASTVALVNVAALIALIAYVQVAFRIHWGYATVALIAVPFVQIEATSMTVDLLASSLTAIGILATLDYVLHPRTFSWYRLIVGLTALAAASATKLQVYPVVVVTVGVFAAVVLCRHVRGTPNLLQFKKTFPARGGVLLAILVVVSVVSVWQIRNTVVYSNPVYPVGISAFGMELPGRVAGRVSLSEKHIENPPILRWAASLVEYRAYDQRPTPWIKSQGSVPHEAWSFRIGGFFGVYVLLLVFFLFYSAYLNEDKSRGRTLLGVFGVYTVLFMLLPASYYLRYNIWWMLLLVLVTLVAVSDVRRQSKKNGRETESLLRGVVICCCVATLSASGFRYVLPAAYGSVEAWVERHSYRTEINQNIDDTDVVCMRFPNAFYYARVFHPGAKHKTKQIRPSTFKTGVSEWVDSTGCTYVPS